MIGVIVVLGLVNALGWSFPNQWNVFGATLGASPVVVEIILWLVLVYLCWEYWINIKSRLSGFRVSFAQIFFELHKSHVLDFYREKYASEEAKIAKARQFEGSRLNEFFVRDVSETMGSPTRSGRIVKIVLIFGREDGAGAQTVG